MRAVVQRVGNASVTIDGEVTGSIKRGSVVLLGVECGDAEKDVALIASKIANLRIFDDEDGKMNLSLLDIDGEVLLISQFTLLGDARKGNRPSYIRAARPEAAIPLYEAVKNALCDMGIVVYTGRFGADMDVTLTNCGPVTVLLDSHRLF